MNNLLKEIVVFLVKYSGLPFFIRTYIAKKRVSISVYHDPKPDVLEKHLNYLSKRYNFITLDCLVNAIYSRNWAGMPSNSLVITLDDGPKGNYSLLQVFKRYNVTPTIYICSQIVNSSRHYWFKAKNIEPDRFKKLSNSHRLRALNESLGFNPVKEYDERQALNQDEIMRMKDIVDFQSHSCFHPILTTCDDDECKREIVQSKTDMEAFSKEECKHFAYPNGDYTEREITLVRKAGYLSARTIDVGWNHQNSNPYELKAQVITDNASVNLLIAQLNGITQYLRCFLKGSVTGKRPTIKLQNGQMRNG